MRKVFEVELGSQSEFYTELTLPAAPYTLLDALEKLRLEEGELPNWEILRTPSCDKIFPYLDPDGSLFELNALCQQLALLDDRQLAIVEGLVKMEHEQGKRPVPMSRLIDMAYSTDRCHLVEEATNDHTLGRFCVEYGFSLEGDDLSDEAIELLDFAKIGREFRQNEGGVFTSGGYVQKHDELRQVYKFLNKKPNTIHYFDPPYFMTEGMYKPVFTRDDHRRLHDLVPGSEGYVIVSYNDDVFIRDMYRDCYILAFTRQNTMSQKAGAKFGELLITNFDPRPIIEIKAQLSMFGDLPSGLKLVNIPN